MRIASAGRALWTGVVWGFPLALGATFLLRIVAGSAAPLTATFWGMSAFILFLCLLPGKGVEVGRRFPLRR